MDFGTEQVSRTKITNSPTGNCHANKTPTSLPYQSHPQIFRQVRQRWPEKPGSFSLSGAALCNPKREARGSVENKAFTMTPDNCATDRGGISITRWHRAHPSSVSIRSIRGWQSRSAFGASGEGHASRCMHCRWLIAMVVSRSSVARGTPTNAAAQPPTGCSNHTHSATFPQLFFLVWNPWKGAKVAFILQQPLWHPIATAMYGPSELAPVMKTVRRGHDTAGLAAALRRLVVGAAGRRKWPR